MRRGRGRLGRLLAGTMVVASAWAGLTPLSGAAPTAAAAPSVQWQRCFRSLAPGLQCGSVKVPLDYDEPNGRHFPIAMTRLLAADPSERIGSLFVNPGGPGGSGVDFVLAIAKLEQFGLAVVDPEVRDRFDIVGFDPRGIARSKPLRCFGDPSEWIFAPFPVTAEEEADAEFADRYLADACETRGGRIQDHMSTANVARDLDVLRRAVGDRGLNYVGYSYGSFLGTVYANLFPQKVRAVVVDGVLDPIAWTTGRPGQGSLPFSTRLRSDAGAQATLLEFFRLCNAGGPNCAFAPNAAARFAALADQLLAGPIDVVDPETGDIFPFTYQDLIGNTLGAMYDAASWPDLAQLLAFLDAEARPARIGARLKALQAKLGGTHPLGRNTPRYYNDVEGFPGVACSDSNNPDSYRAWSEAGAAADEQFGYFGRLWTWVTSICAVWTGFDDDRYLGPFDAETANPVLIVGTRFDPATRYEGAVTLSHLLPNSSLLTVDGWGHTSLFVSACSNAAVARYLVDGVTPAPGTVCPADVVPFADAPMSRHRVVPTEIRSVPVSLPGRDSGHY
jgi:pimeloyl-ACP methyl ester carboxylesterase